MRTVRQVIFNCNTATNIALGITLKTKPKRQLRLIFAGTEWQAKVGSCAALRLDTEPLCGNRHVLSHAVFISQRPGMAVLLIVVLGSLFVLSYIEAVVAHRQSVSVEGLGNKQKVTFELRGVLPC